MGISDESQYTSRTFCWPFIAWMPLSTLSSVPCRSSNILQYDGWRISTSLLCFEILFGALFSPEGSPDDVTLESRASLLPSPTLNKFWSIVIPQGIYEQQDIKFHISKSILKALNCLPCYCCWSFCWRKILLKRTM